MASKFVYKANASAAYLQLGTATARLLFVLMRVTMQQQLRSAPPAGSRASMVLTLCVCTSVSHQRSKQMGCYYMASYCHDFFFFFLHSSNSLLLSTPTVEGLLLLSLYFCRSTACKNYRSQDRQPFCHGPTFQDVCPHRG